MQRFEQIYAEHHEAVRAYVNRRVHALVALPEGTAECKAQAHYANGVLEVHLEKPEQSNSAASRS
jgi:HSP20 family molecular chaperone IbpA